MNRKFLLLDCSPSANKEKVDFNTRQLMIGLQTVGEVILMTALEDGKPIDLKEFERHAAEIAPTDVIWSGVHGFFYADILERFAGRITALWYDDPLMCVENVGLGEMVKKCARLPNFNAFIWDGYWRDRALQLWNLRSQPTHLAVDAAEFYESDSILNDDEIVFIGHLHSPRKIETGIEILPPFCQRLARTVQESVVAIKGNAVMPCWDVLLHNAEREIEAGDKKLLAMEVKHNSLALAKLRELVWMMAKNEARLRMLREAIQVAPVRIFADMEQLGHATPMEYRALLGQWGDKRLRVASTTGYAVADLAACYHVGRLHISATDPQSVRGGIPYRLFQTAASGRALLADTRPEFSECFEDGKEVLTYAPGGFGEALAAAYQDKDRLREIGRAARARVLADHTWAIRVRQILGLSRDYNPRQRINKLTPTVSIQDLKFIVEKKSNGHDSVNALKDAADQSINRLSNLSTRVLA